MSLYKRDGSDIWWASVTVGGQRVRESTGEYDRKAAQKVHDKLKASRHDAPVLKGKTWGSAVMKWAEAETRGTADLLMLAKFGRHYPDRLLSSVDEKSIERALKLFCRTDGTFNRYTAIISAVLNFSGAKVKVIRRKDKTAKPREWLTRKQWDALYKELKPHMKPIALFAVSTGLRQANVLGLTWDRVDLDRKLVWVEAEDMKGGKAVAVPLNKAALHVLKTIQGANPYWVFTFRGQPVTEIKTAFHAACIRAGVGRISVADGSIKGSPGVNRAAGTYEGFTWHGLRHTWATWHIQAGTPLEVLQQLGGWADLRMVQNYAHHSPGHLASYADNMEKR